MTEDGYLNLLALLAAGYGLLSPVRRSVLPNFVPFREAGFTILFSFACLLLRRLGQMELVHFSSIVSLMLQVLAWMFPVLWLLTLMARYRRGRILGFTKLKVDEVLNEALLSGDFTEASRYLLTNRLLLPKVEDTERELLFVPEVIAGFRARRSEIHLDLLSDSEFLTSLRRPLESAEAVIRSQISSLPSPLQSFVLSTGGGYEGFRPSSSDRKVFESTFDDPSWCLRVNAHYPIILSAIETLRKGELDSHYASTRPTYVSRQGPSERATCKVFLAEKALGRIALRAAEAGVDGDFYFTDFWQLYEEVLNRLAGGVASRPTPKPWEWESIPFAFLLDEIVSDLEAVIQAALRAEHASGHEGTLRLEGPGRPRLVADAAKAWLLCCWEDSRQAGSSVGEPLLRHLQDYLELAQDLRFEPHRQLYGERDTAATRPWADKLLDLLKEHLLSKGATARGFLARAIDGLDIGKWHVSGETRADLRRRLGLLTGP